MQAPEAAPTPAGASSSHPRTRLRSRLGPAPEAAFSLVLGLLLAVIVRRPQDLATTVPADPRDPALISWILAWPAHALTTGQSLWDANIFAPLANSAAFTDTLLGYLPFGLIGDGPAAALVRYNLLLLLAFALAFAGMWVLVRQLGLGRAAALVAATAFAFNPWRVSQLNHLQVLSTGGIPLALAMLARGHGIGLRVGARRVRPGWALAGWLTATWQISIGFGIGLQVAYLLALCTAVAAARAVVLGLRGGRWPERRLLGADGVGIVLMLAISALLAQPYFEVVEDHPESRRSVQEITFYSTGPQALTTAPADSWLWGRYSEQDRAGVGGINEKALFPGLLPTTLAVAGLLLPGPWSRRRVLLLGAAVVALVVFALGTAGPAGGRWSYLLLYEHAPGWQGIRTPSRLVTTAWLGLALLAAHGVAVLLRASARVGGRPGGAPVRHVTLGVGLALASLALLEGLDTAPRSSVPTTPPVPLDALPEPLMVLPSVDHFDQIVMLWSTDGFPRVVNGISGFQPAQQLALREAADRLPEPEAVTQLRRSGVASLLIIPSAFPGTQYDLFDPQELARVPGVSVDVRGEAVVVLLGTGS